jgi:hypothetical protein
MLLGRSLENEAFGKPSTMTEVGVVSRRALEVEDDDGRRGFFRSPPK